MDHEINKAIQILQDEIKEKQDFINMLQTLNLSEPVTEKRWHEICETPLRSSNVLGIVLKQVFPEAEDIKVSCNYVFFSLFGFACAVPTSLVQGVEVKTDWYKKDRGMPKKEDMYYGIDDRMKKYFKAVDDHESWETLLSYRVPASDKCRKWVRFCVWFFHYKWKDDYREKWEEKFRQDEERYEEAVQAYHKEREEMKEKATRLKNDLLPELHRFAAKVRTYRSNSLCQCEIDDILKREGL